MSHTRSGSVTVRMNATPGEIFTLVTDIRNMRRWSPEVYRCDWMDGATGPAPGVRFKGRSKSNFLRWARTVEVKEVVPDRLFSFTTLKDFVNRDSTTWTYRFEPDGDGWTLVVESFEAHELPSLPIKIVSWLARRPHDMTPHMAATLARIKAEVESPVGQRKIVEP